MTWYHYRQNNSGGNFVGPINVIVEADSAEHADVRAQDVAGIYFDGIAAGRDCGCCGNRWYRATSYNGEDFPHVCGEPVAEAMENEPSTWLGGSTTPMIYPMDKASAN